MQETFRKIYTIQYHCIKCCSQGRRKIWGRGEGGYCNGLTREALPERGTFPRLQVHEMEGFFMVEGCEREICHLFERFIHIVKTVYRGVLTAVKRDAAFLLVKGVLFDTRGFTKGLPILSKIVYRRVRCFTLGRASSYKGPSSGLL